MNSETVKFLRCSGGSYIFGMGNYNKVIILSQYLNLILADVIASDLIFSEWEDGRTPTADIKFSDKELNQVTDR